jgi:hypothetical protein
VKKGASSDEWKQRSVAHSVHLWRGGEEGVGREEGGGRGGEGVVKQAVLGGRVRVEVVACKVRPRRAPLVKWLPGLLLLLLLLLLYPLPTHPLKAGSLAKLALLAPHPSLAQCSPPMSPPKPSHCAGARMFAAGHSSGCTHPSPLCPLTSGWRPGQSTAAALRWTPPGGRPCWPRGYTL